MQLPIYHTRSQPVIRFVNFVHRCHESLRKYKKDFLTGPQPIAESMTAPHRQLTQRDLVILQFGFMGYALLRPRFLGIRVAPDSENLKGFVHFWRVIGHSFGLRDEFNLCTGSVDETRARLIKMTLRVVGPLFVRHREVYHEVINAFLDLFWYLRPLISLDSILFLTNRLAGIPGYYLNRTEQQEQLRTIDEHRHYFRRFNMKRVHIATCPDCSSIYVDCLRWMDKVIVSGVVFVVEGLIWRSVFWRTLFNVVTLFVRLLVRKLAFVVDRSWGFSNTYLAFRQHRNAALKKRRP